MLTLWFCGSLLEGAYGGRWLKELYFTSAIGGAAVASAISFTHVLRLSPQSVANGAWAGIFGVMVGLATRMGEQEFLLRRQHLRAVDRQHRFTLLDGVAGEIDEDLLDPAIEARVDVRDPRLVVGDLADCADQPGLAVPLHGGELHANQLLALGRNLDRAGRHGCRCRPADCAGRGRGFIRVDWLERHAVWSHARLVRVVGRVHGIDVVEHSTFGNGPCGRASLRRANEVAARESGGEEREQREKFDQFHDVHDFHDFHYRASVHDRRAGHLFEPAHGGVVGRQFVEVGHFVFEHGPEVRQDREEIDGTGLITRH